MSRLIPVSSDSRTTHGVLIAVVVVGLLIAIWQVRSTLLLVLASVILVVLFTMPIRFLVRRGMNRTPATIISLLGILVLFTVIMLVVLPSLLEQFAILATTVPAGIRELADQWENGQLVERYPWLESVQLFIQNILQTQSLDQLITEVTRQLGNALGQLGGSVLPVVSGVASTLLSILIVVFLSLYFLADPRMHEEGLIKLFPLWYRDRVRQIMDRIDFTLRGWLQGQLLLMLIVGIASWFGLAAIGIEQAAALGVLAGLFSFVPNFGPIAALVPALAAGFAQGSDRILLIIVIIYGTSFLQSQIISPIVFKESINLPPVLVLVGQILAAIFFGFLGLMLAVPMTAILLVLVQEVYVKDILGDRMIEEQIRLDEALMPDGV
jgi:predicted PurR-regulated permease PerM